MTTPHHQVERWFDVQTLYHLFLFACSFRYSSRLFFFFYFEFDFFFLLVQGFPFVQLVCFLQSLPHYRLIQHNIIFHIVLVVIELESSFFVLKIFLVPAAVGALGNFFIFLIYSLS